VILVNRSRSITLDARDKQDNRDTLAPAFQRRSSPDGLPAPLRHVSINIDRRRPRGKPSVRPCATLAKEFPDTRRFLRADTSDLSQGGRISGENAFDAAKVNEEPMCESRTDTRQPLQQEEPPRREALRLPVESSQNSLVRSACLFGKEPQKSH
jgi:hypothetical protein